MPFLANTFFLSERADRNLSQKTKGTVITLARGNPWVAVSVNRGFMSSEQTFG